MIYGGDFLRSFDNFLNVLLFLALFGVWKVVDILIWLYQHVDINFI